VVILALGHKTGWVADATSGEGRDSSSLDLPGRQRELLAAVSRTGVPTVVVLVNGRPAPIGVVAGEPRAVLEAWQPGAVGMDHVADVLFGDLNPSGKLPITVPRTAGQCPIYYGQATASSYATKGLQRYTDVSASPAYPFGHGLSYTEFTYLALEVRTPVVNTDGLVSVSVEVTNSGKRAGEEVVQLYARAAVRGVTRPAKELIGFTRLALDPAGSCVVDFDIPVELLACIGMDSQLAVHPGSVMISAGGSSADNPVSAGFTITGPRKVLTQRSVFFSHVSVRHGS
jgi:beta-glucosidase